MVDSCVSISRMEWVSGVKGYVRSVLASTLVGIAGGGCCDWRCHECIPPSSDVICTRCVVFCILEGFLDDRSWNLKDVVVVSISREEQWGVVCSS